MFVFYFISTFGRSVHTHTIPVDHLIVQSAVIYLNVYIYIFIYNIVAGLCILHVMKPTLLKMYLLKDLLNGHVLLKKKKHTKGLCEGKANISVCLLQICLKSPHFVFEGLFHALCKYWGKGRVGKCWAETGEWDRQKATEMGIEPTAVTTKPLAMTQTTTFNAH